MSRDPRAGSRLEELDLEALFTTSFRTLTSSEVFRRLPGSIWTEEFFRSSELLNLYTDFQVAAVLERLGVEPGKRYPVDPSWLAARGVVESRLDSARWLLAKASRSVFAGKDRGNPEAAGGPGEFTFQAAPSGFGRRLSEAVLKDSAVLAPCLKLVDVAAAGFPGFLSGEAEGRSILFSPAALDLWESYFDTLNPFYQPVNRLAAGAAAEAMEAVEGEALTVLEVGAGCGSASATLLEELSGRPPGRYVVSDVSPNFLRKARSRLEGIPEAERTGVEFRLLDMNRPSESWRLPEGGFHLIFAVNVLHCVRDPVGTLSSLRTHLRPGGALVLGEGLRPERGRPVHPEFIFQLLDEFRDVAVNPAVRPSWGFLDGRGWQSVLAQAGFEELTFIPDVEMFTRTYPEHTIAAIVARG